MEREREKESSCSNYMSSSTTSRIRRSRKTPNLVDVVVQSQLLDGINAHVLGGLHGKPGGSFSPTTCSPTPVGEK